ncbi:MAG: hypothetical protein AAGA56_27160, partial [Myxococcota bacterium]
VRSRALCRRVLEFDFNSNSRLFVRAALPFVRDTPSVTSMVALIQAQSDARPFVARIDLDARPIRYTELNSFEPRDAENVVVLGVGGTSDRDEGVVVLRYNQGERIVHEAQFFDFDAELTARVPLNGYDEITEYGIAGFLQTDDSGLWAGVDNLGRVVVLDTAGGGVQNVSDFNPVGVHRWDGNLYVVGVDAANVPRVAPMDDAGGIGPSTTWDAAGQASSLPAEVEVVDDRFLPSRVVTWSNPRNAIGPWPFVSPHNPQRYADETVGWVIAGPTFTASGTDVRTAIGFAPVGIDYEP